MEIKPVKVNNSVKADNVTVIKKSGKGLFAKLIFQIKKSFVLKTKLKIDFFSLLFPILFYAVITLLCTIYKRPNVQWFEELIKPVFFPNITLTFYIWLVMFILLSLSLTFALKNKCGIVMLVQYTANGVFNFLLVIFFFIAKSLFASLILIVIMGIQSYIILSTVYRTSRTAFYLYLPYFLWLIFTATLIYSLLMLN